MSEFTEIALPINYEAVLADLERRHAQLEAAIAAIESLLEDQRTYEEGLSNPVAMRREGA